MFEFCIGVADLDAATRQWQRFGYRAIAFGTLSPPQTRMLYRADMALRSQRLQHGQATYSFVRLVEAAQLAVPGRAASWRWPGARWGARLAAGLETLREIVDWADNSRLTVRGPYTVPMDDRPAKAVLDPALTPAIIEFDCQGPQDSHVFFARHGFDRTGYGTISEHAEFPVSEITHVGVVTTAAPTAVRRWFEEGLGLVPNAWEHHDARRIRANGNGFMFPLQETDSYQLLDFMPKATDASAPSKRPGKFNVYCFSPETFSVAPPAAILGRGPTLYTLRHPEVKLLAERAPELGAREIGTIGDNEFGERSLLLRGPEGYWWQVVET